VNYFQGDSLAPITNMPTHSKESTASFNHNLASAQAFNDISETSSFDNRKPVSLNLNNNNNNLGNERRSRRQRLGSSPKSSTVSEIIIGSSNTVSYQVEAKKEEEVKAKSDNQ
jgi:hypothetical protein